jgi:hypothetical protein
VIPARLALPAVLAIAAGCASNRTVEVPAQSGMSRPAPATGEDVLRRMHEAHTGTWYRTLTFTQTTAFADGRVETWREAMAIPGRLRIDVGPVEGGNASIFRSDSLYVFQRGKRERSAPFVHPLLVLGFDVYGAPPEATIERVRALRVDLARLSQGTWQGRPAWILGAEPGDTATTQIWIDVERLVFVRLIERRPAAGNAPEPELIETQFNNYQRLAGGWIAPEVVFRVNGVLRLTETYSDMRADVALDSRLFDADEYRPPARGGSD